MKGSMKGSMHWCCAKGHSITSTSPGIASPPSILNLGKCSLLHSYTIPCASRSLSPGLLPSLSVRPACHVLASSLAVRPRNQRPTSQNQCPTDRIPIINCSPGESMTSYANPCVSTLWIEAAREGAGDGGRARCDFFAASAL